MSHGVATRFRFDGVAALAGLIGALEPHEALALGALQPDLPQRVDVVTKAELNKLNGTTPPHWIARTGSHLIYRTGQPAPSLLDFDSKGMPAATRTRLDAAGGFWPSLVSIIPALADATHVRRRSTSAGLYRTDNGEMLSGSDGEHVYLVIKDGADNERFLKTLHARCWLNGFGWLMVGAGGQLLERSIVDRMVAAPERLVFEGAPVLEPPLAQDMASRRPIVSDGKPLDTIAACPPLSIIEQAKFREACAKEAARIAPEVAKAKAGFIDRQARRLAKKTGMMASQARRILERQCSGVLLPDIILPFDDPEFAGCTVADVLSNPRRFEGSTLADPLEGVEYGRCKARIMQREDGTPWIHSFAHGRTEYTLKYDADAVEAAVRKAAPDRTVELFVRLMLAADVNAVETERLRRIVSQRDDIGLQALKGVIKEARQAETARKKEEERSRRLAERTDPRPAVPVPLPDDPWLPQMKLLNEILNPRSNR